MKQLKLFGILGLLSLTVIAFCLSIVLAQPSDAVGTKYQRLIELGIVDAVVTPQEVGLDYLQQEPIQLAADDKLMAAIHQAEQAVAVMPEDIPLEFPAGTNSPIEIGRIPNDPGTPRQASGNIIDGFVTPNGQPETFDPGGLRGIFTDEYQNRGQISMTPEAQQILVADASGGVFQAKRIPVIDLIVRNPRTNRRVVVRNVVANAVCRDALNAVFNRSLRRINR